MTDCVRVATSSLRRDFLLSARRRALGSSCWKGLLSVEPTIPCFSPEKQLAEVNIIAILIVMFTQKMTYAVEQSSQSGTLPLPHTDLVSGNQLKMQPQRSVFLRPFPYPPFPNLHLSYGYTIRTMRCPRRLDTSADNGKAFPPDGRLFASRSSLELC